MVVAKHCLILLYCRINIFAVQDDLIELYKYFNDSSSKWRNVRGN